MLTIGSLFSGIGGLELGLERAGLGPVLWQAECDPYARRVLRKHWPDALLFNDVREIGVHNAPRVDLICGGFPCQDLSRAGTGWARPGLEGERSGMWWEYRRIVGEIRPRWVLVENVDNVWRDWVPVVRGSVAGLGYASVPLRVRAEDVGAPFRGSRVFVVAQADDGGESTGAVHAALAELSQPARPDRQDWGLPSPRAVGVADGVPAMLDRLRACGNAVVPAVAEFIGRRILTTLPGAKP